MKHTFILFAALFMALSLSAKRTVYFVNKIGWEHVYAFAATGDNWRPENAVWPGEDLQQLRK